MRLHYHEIYFGILLIHGGQCSCVNNILLFRCYCYLLFYVTLKDFSLIWRRHHCRWRAAKLRPILGAQGLWAGVACGLGFSGLIRRTAPFSRLLRYTMGCGESIVTRILTSLLLRGDVNSWLTNSMLFGEYEIYFTSETILIFSRVRSKSEYIIKVLFHEWNKYHIHQSLNFLFITFSLLSGHVCFKSERF
jgi:hypothetical protein